MYSEKVYKLLLFFHEVVFLSQVSNNMLIPNSVNFKCVVEHLSTSEYEELHNFRVAIGFESWQIVSQLRDPVGSVQAMDNGIEWEIGSLGIDV